MIGIAPSVVIEVPATGGKKAAIPVVDSRGVPAVGEQSQCGVSVHLHHSYASFRGPLGRPLEEFIPTLR